MNNITNEPKNEADTGATVPASTVTAAYQEQSVVPYFAAANGAGNQKTDDPQPEKKISTQPTMVMSAYGFKVPPKKLPNPSSSGFASKSGRITLEEYWAQLDSLPVPQSPEEADSKDKAVVTPPISTPILSQVEVPQEQSPQSETAWETPPPIGKKPPVLNSVPQPFQSFPECPAPGEGCNAWCLSAALACERYGLSPEETTALIRSQISRAPKGNEIERAVKKAYLTDPLEKLPPSITTKFDEAELRALAYKAPNWGFENLKNVSPVDVRNCTTIQYLRHIFKIRERVIIATRINDRGTIWLNDPDDPNSREDELDTFKYPPGRQGAWFLSNPVNGEAIKLERLQTPTNPHGESFRA